MAARAGQQRADSTLACPGAVRRRRSTDVAERIRAASRPSGQSQRWAAVTHPAVETTQSGVAADAVRTLQSELSGDYSEMRSAEIQLTEAILSAHAVTMSGRTQLQDIQRQLIEAINNPVAALDTPAGERHFLMFLRGKISEIQDVVDNGALTDEDHARLTRALGSGYLLPTSGRDESVPQAPSSAGTPMTDQSAGMAPAIGSALGALPQAAQGAATAPAQGAAGLAGAASPLGGDGFRSPRTWRPTRPSRRSCRAANQSPTTPPPSTNTPTPKPTPKPRTATPKTDLPTRSRRATASRRRTVQRRPGPPACCRSTHDNHPHHPVVVESGCPAT